jgi:hypothetical protein
MTPIPNVLVAYHESGRPLYCDLAVQPWGCEFWPLAELQWHNDQCLVQEFAPGYLGFGTSGGGEMFALSPDGRVVCLAFIGMSPTEELAVANSWKEFESLLSQADR